VRNNGKYCNKCKSIGHVDECKDRKIVSTIPFIQIDAKMEKRGEEREARACFAGL
jgi:hypothetical protein